MNLDRSQRLLIVRRIGISSSICNLSLSFENAIVARTHTPSFLSLFFFFFFPAVSTTKMLYTEVIFTQNAGRKATRTWSFSRNTKRAMIGTTGGVKISGAVARMNALYIFAQDFATLKLQKFSFFLEKRFCILVMHRGFVMLWKKALYIMSYNYLTRHLPPKILDYCFLFFFFFVIVYSFCALSSSFSEELLEEVFLLFVW